MEQVTSASTWKKSSQGEAVQLKVPSGNVALVKNLGMRAFISRGLIPNTLLPIVTEALERGKPPSGRVLAEEIGKKGTKALEDVFDLVDRVVIECVVDPVVSKIPEEDETRDPELLYVDEVDLEDKMFIFQWVVGGTRDIARFRAEYQADVDNIQSSEDVEDKAV